MALDSGTLRVIDDKARTDLGEGPTKLFMQDNPGPLNYRRAFRLLEHLEKLGAPPANAEATLRENWPEAWRTNGRDDQRFGDEWF